MVEVSDVTGLCNTVYSFFLRQIYWHIVIVCCMYFRGVFQGYTVYVSRVYCVFQGCISMIYCMCYDIYCAV